MLAEKWVNSVVDVKRVSARVMSVRLDVRGELFAVVAGYAPQMGRARVEKERFYGELETACEVAQDELLVVGGDMNGHVGQGQGDFVGVHGGNGLGARNEGGTRLLEFAAENGMVVANTLWERSDRRLVTYESGESRTQVDYVLARESDVPRIRDVFVVGEIECARQHRLVVSDLVVQAERLSS